MTDVELQGFHAVKHALRFGAVLTELLTPDLAAVERLRRDLAPDLDLGAAGLVEVDAATWRDRTVPLPSPLLGVAARPAWSLGDAVAGDGPLVVLEEPRHLGNLGAVVRVAAAAGAAGVVTTGPTDPWHPTAVRTSAGLHFALPVVAAPLDEAVGAARDAGREVVAVDGEADAQLHAAAPGPSAVLLLGTERRGLSPAARDAADRAVAIPMRAGVSSLNLATAAAVVLYAVGDA